MATLERLSRSAPMVAPSMLRCDFGNLAREIESLELAGAKLLHWDVMDGHFVPNLTYGPVLLERVRRCTDLPFDAHLMIADPGRYLDDYLAAGCDAITIHLEAVPQPQSLLERIRSGGAVAGLAINPGTPVEKLEPLLTHCDLILVMSVEPGFGGQKFMPASLDKLRWLKPRVAPGTLLSIDGGIAQATIAGAAAAGAGLFVVGSALFDPGDYANTLQELEGLAAATAVH